VGEIAERDILTIFGAHENISPVVIIRKVTTEIGLQGIRCFSWSACAHGLFVVQKYNGILNGNDKTQLANKARLFPNKTTATNLLPINFEHENALIAQIETIVQEICQLRVHG
jgi:hypothetical protein